MSSSSSEPSTKRQRTNQARTPLIFDPSDLDLDDINFMRKILDESIPRDELLEYIMKFRTHHIQKYLLSRSPKLKPLKKPKETKPPDEIVVVRSRGMVGAVKGVKKP